MIFEFDVSQCFIMEMSRKNRQTKVIRRALDCGTAFASDLYDLYRSCIVTKLPWLDLKLWVLFRVKFAACEM